MKRFPSWNNLIFIGIAIAITAGILLLPWHMDEYVMFHALACWDPAQKLNTFRESCPGNPTGLGALTYYRSYAYIGVISSVLMAPFHMAWPSLATNSLAGILYAGLSGLGLTKSFNINWKYLGIIYLYFPVSYSMIHDGGPIRLSLLTICWTPYLLERLISTEKPSSKALVWLLVVCLWLASVEDKPFFMYLIPGSYFFVLACLESKSKLSARIRNARFTTGIFAINSLLAIALLYFMKSDGEPYLLYLRKNSPDWNQRVTELASSIRFFFDWPYFAFRVTEDSKLSTLGSLASCAAVLVIGTILLRLTWRSSFLGMHIRMLLFSSSSFWFCGWIAGGKFNHHYVFAQIPILAATMICVHYQNTNGSRRATLLLMLSFLSGISVISTTIAPKIWYASTNINGIVQDSLKSSPNSLILNSSSWGVYYAYSLADNQGQPVVWADTTESMNKLEKISHSTGKDVMHLCWNCDESILHSGYPNSEIELAFENEANWKSYRISKPSGVKFSRTEG